MKIEDKKLIDSYVHQLKDGCEGGFVVVDVCKKCGKVTITKCKHTGNYNNQCEHCGNLTGFIGRIHSN